LSLFDEADLAVGRVKPEVMQGGLRGLPAQTKETIREPLESNLMDQVLSRQNMRDALKRVRQNNGAAGIDGVPAKELTDYLLEHWPAIHKSLLEGTYQPQPVRRVEISKPTGGVRLLGIPTAVDRLIQQAVLQVLTPILDPQFSASSYGFRPRRRGHTAVRQAREYVREGYTWVVDIDLEKFFDRVNHDMLMARVARKVFDKQLLSLIRRFLNSGVMIDGVVVTDEEGTPQGGPLSPLLSNIMLDDLDKELERRGHKFVRYADDCNIYVHSQRSGERVKASVTAFLEKRLRLRINESKSAVDRPWNRKFLGFTLEPRKRRIVLAAQSIVRVKAKIRSLTQRSAAMSLSERILQLNQYLGGWIGYFALAEHPSEFKELGSWTRRRLRMCLWKQWKLIRTRVRKLRGLGLKETQVWAVAGSQLGCWRLARSHSLHLALNNAYWRTHGLEFLEDRYQAVRNKWRTAVCGPACTVV
jgi:group II intron reverse transcriptase/maturase